MSVPSVPVRRWEPYAGIAYVVFFVASTMVSNPPADNASDRTWVARYTGHSEQAGHLATAFLLLLAGLALMTFLVALWRRMADVRPDEPLSRLPVAAAGATAALMGAGGMVMGYISGGELIGRYPLPGADLLRMSNDLGFALAGVAGSWAAALAVVTLSIQGHSVGIFGTKMRAAGIITALLLLFSIIFAPILALLAWVLVAAISWIRQSRRQRARNRLGSPDARAHVIQAHPIPTHHERFEPMHRPTSVSGATPAATAATATASAIAIVLVIVVAVFAWPANAAGSSRSHTLHLTALRAAEVQFGKAGFTEADKVLNGSGRTIGTGLSDCRPVSSTRAHCTGALGVKGGLLDARFSLNLENGHIAGKVTGGTMAYRHVKGTMSGTSFNGGSHLTVIYRRP